MLEAPGTIASNEATLRPLVASWLICWPVTTSLISPVSDCTWIAFASTVMVSFAAPSCIWKSTRARSATFSKTFLCSASLKPDAFALTS